MNRTHSSAGAFQGPVNAPTSIFQWAIETIATLLNPRGYRVEMERYEEELRQRKQGG